MKFLQMMRYAVLGCPFRRAYWEHERYMVMSPLGVLKWNDHGVVPTLLGSNPQFDIREEDIHADDWEVGLINVEATRPDGMGQPTSYSFWSI